LALRTVAISARVERDAPVAAGVALFDVAAEGGSAALFDRAHGTQLPAAERIGMRLTKCGPEAAEDIRHFQRRGGHGCAGQKYVGGVGGGEGSGRGSRSKGLVVAHTVVVATFR